MKNRESHYGAKVMSGQELLIRFHNEWFILIRHCQKYPRSEFIAELSKKSSVSSFCRNTSESEVQTLLTRKNLSLIEELFNAQWIYGMLKTGVLFN